ncbi:hypothetical protein SAMN04489712_10438 [Thermomonospora echinospora]|uniref:Uncharacterized protein n=1 Tax=Thermomonospora echinospora TaxID=1992 RepID=A0A1H5YJ14_9ACTN|nr:hypothetical protein [Thermomonospora echinospora]SEG23984.1 hypothetical protein SAMN04489712_10438 [Thermomonospora echinospora]
MDANTVTAVCAVVIALGSLAVSVTETRMTRQHNRHSVRPILQLRRTKLLNDVPAGLRVVNCGLGPAIITKTLVRLDGNPVGGWNLPTYRQVTDGFPIQPRVTTLTDGAALPVGHEAFLLRLDDFEDERHSWFWELITVRLQVEIHYQSLYGGKTFVATTTPWPGNRPTPQ